MFLGGITGVNERGMNLLSVVLKCCKIIDVASWSLSSTFTTRLLTSVGDTIILHLQDYLFSLHFCFWEDVNW